MTKINSWARYIHSLPRLLLSSTLSPNISVCHDFLASPVRRAHSCVFNYRGTFNFPPSILDVLDGRSEIIHPVGICGGSRRGEEKRAREASKQAWGREREREWWIRATETQRAVHPLSVGEGLSRTDTSDRDKSSDLSRQSATSSSTGGPTMKSRIIIMSVRTYSHPVRQCSLRERNTTWDIKHPTNLFSAHSRKIDLEIRDLGILGDIWRKLPFVITRC